MLNDQCSLLFLTNGTNGYETLSHGSLWRPGLVCRPHRSRASTGSRRREAK